MKLHAIHYRTGREVAFEAARGLIRGLKGPLICGPGFCDLQCNGFAGVDFNHPGTTPEQIALAVLAMRKTGVTQLLPTVITAAPERLEHLLRNIARAIAIDRQVRAAVPGIHLEGPWISAEDGARGAHPAKHVRAIDRRLWARLQRAAAGEIRMVTIAPELRNAPALIRQLRQERVLPALGHTIASEEQIAAAVEAGALLSTHLGNGCPQMLHRHRNPIYAQLAEDRLSASLIADGVHLPPAVLRTFFRAKGAARILLVTDAMAAAGAPPGRYTLGDLLLEVGTDRVVKEPGKPHFAGSALTMDRAVSILVRAAQVRLVDAWDAASIRPRKLLEIATGQRISQREVGTIIAAWDGRNFRVLNFKE